MIFYLFTARVEKRLDVDKGLNVNKMPELKEKVY